jgi:hypothetical protein
VAVAVRQTLHRRALRQHAIHLGQTVESSKTRRLNKDSIPCNQLRLRLCRWLYLETWIPFDVATMDHGECGFEASKENNKPIRQGCDAKRRHMDYLQHGQSISKSISTSLTALAPFHLRGIRTSACVVRRHSALKSPFPSAVVQSKVQIHDYTVLSHMCPSRRSTAGQTDRLALSQTCTF